MEFIDYTTFAGKLQKNDLDVFKIDIAYPLADSRCWSALINRNTDNIVVTFSVNRQQYGDKSFDIFYDNKILTDIAVDDIYDTIDLLTRTQIPSIIFNNENV
jgi:hypothetical protein